MQNSSDTVTISKKEYESLLEDADFLTALEYAGVENWDGYSIAYRAVHGEGDD